MLILIDNYDSFTYNIVQLLGTEVVCDDGSSSQMIHRNVEKALNLAGMEVNSHDTGHTSSGHEVGHQLGRDGLTTTGLAVLAGISVVRHHCRHAVSRGALAGISHDEQLHEVVIDRIGRGLDDENILATDAFADHYLGLTIVEMTDICIAKIHAYMVGNLLGQVRVRVAGQDA